MPDNHIIKIIQKGVFKIEKKNRSFSRKCVCVGTVLLAVFTLNLSPMTDNTRIETVEANSASENRNTWIKKGTEWYFVDDNGTLETGWIKVRNKWYYMDVSGAMQTGWKNVGNRWYYMHANGPMNSKTGWNKIGWNWYYQLPSGAMDTGWRKVGSKWYYLKSNAIMQTGWVKLGDYWYYLDNSGAMQTGWQNIDGTTYYFNVSGQMQSQADSTSFNLAVVQNEFHRLVNQERVANGKRELTYISDLDQAAGIRAYEVREVGGLFSHTRPNGTSFRTVHKKLTSYNSGENALRFSKFNTLPTNK